jgi:hypothetical protein
MTAHTIGTRSYDATNPVSAANTAGHRTLCPGRQGNAYDEANGRVAGGRGRGRYAQWPRGTR